MSQSKGRARSERVVRGRLARKEVARAQHGVWNPKHRERSPIDLIAESMHGRLPHLVDLKYERMAASPFGYFRGAVSVMAYDLSRVPATGIVNQICGDAHLRNLGAYEGLDGSPVFDINDFDETTRAPFEWDVKRLSTSILLAGRESGTRDADSRNAISQFLRRYRRSMHRFMEMPVLAVARFQVQRLNRSNTIVGVLEKAERATPLVSLDNLTIPAALSSSDARKHARSRGKGSRSGGRTGSHKERPEDHKERPASEAEDGGATSQSEIRARKFRSDPPLLERITGKKADAILASLRPYRDTLLPERRHFFDQFRPIDVCFKTVGTGSVGLRDFCIYFEGNGPADPLFLQIKEEPDSAYTRYLPHTASSVPNNGRRVAEGQRAMQFQSDPLLGWTSIEDRDYLVRQLNDHKASINVDDLRSDGLFDYADVCGELLARGHARSGDAAVLGAYLGRSDRFDRAILKFAERYADQTETDWQQLKRSRA